MSENTETAIRIAVVRDMDGYCTCVGPDDFKGEDYRDAMEAAVCFHIEAGYSPVDKRWVTASLPLVSATIPTHEGTIA